MWLSYFGFKTYTLYEEIPLPTQDISLQFQVNSTMGCRKTLSQEEDIRLEAPTLKSIAFNENQFLQWSNDNVEAIRSHKSHGWMGLSSLRKETPILVETRDMQRSENDEFYVENAIGPLHDPILEES